MRIHSNILTPTDLYCSIRAIPEGTGQVMLDFGASTCLVSDAVGPRRFSMTTSQHIGAIHSALALAGKRRRTVPHAVIRTRVGVSL